MKNKGFLRRMFSMGLALATVVGTFGAGTTAHAAETSPAGAGFSIQIGTQGLQGTQSDPYVVSGSTVTYDVTVKNETQNAFKDLKVDFQVPEGTKLKNPNQTISFNHQDFLGSQYGQEGRAIHFTVPVVVDYGITEIGPAYVILNGSAVDGSGNVIATYENAELPSAAKRKGYRVPLAEDPSPKDGGSMTIDGQPDAGYSTTEVGSGEQVVYHMTARASDNFSGKATVTIPLPDMENSKLGRLVSSNPEVDGKPWDVTARPGNVKYYTYGEEPDLKTQAGMVYEITEVKSGDEISFDLAVIMGSYDEDTEVVLSPVIEWQNSNAGVKEPTGKHTVNIPITVKAAQKAPEGPVTCDFQFRLADGQSADVMPGSSVKLDMSGTFRTDLEGVVPPQDVKFKVVVPEGVTVADFISNGSKMEKKHDGAELSFGEVQFGKTVTATLTVVVADTLQNTALVLNGAAYWKDSKSRDANVTLYVNDGVSRVDSEPFLTLEWADYKTDGNYVPSINFGAEAPPRYVRAGDMVTVRYSVKNPDVEKSAQDVLLVVPETENFVMDDDSLARADSIDTDAEGHKAYSFKLGNIQPNMATEVLLRYKAKQVEGGSATSVFDAHLEYANAPVVSDGSVPASNRLTAIHEVPDADSLGVVMRQDGEIGEIKVGPGQNVAYEIEVLNNGNVDLKNVVVTSRVPDGLIYGRSNDTRMKQKDGTVTWTIPTVKAGETVSAKFGVTVPKTAYADSYTAKATAKADEIDGIDSNEVTMRVGKGDLSISLSQKKGDSDPTKDELEVEAGESFTYIITVKNKGTAPVTDAMVKMSVPGMLTINGEPGNTRISGQNVDWYLKDLKEGKSQTLELDVTAPTKTYSNTGSSAGTNNKSVKDTLIRAYAGLSWRDTTGKAESLKSNTVTTRIKYRTEGVNTGSESQVNKNNAAQADDNNKTKAPKVNNTGLDLLVVSDAMNAVGNGHMMVYQDKENVTVTATWNEKLPSGKEYTGTVGLVDENGGIVKGVDGKDCSAAVKFTANGKTGAIGTYKFVIGGKDFVGKSIYGAMDVTAAGGSKVAFRSDGIEKGTLHSASIMGVGAENPEVSMADNGTLKASVAYDNAVPGQSYQMVIALVNKSTGKVMTRSDKKAVSGTQTFKAEKESGSVDVQITFGESDAKATDLAIYSTMYDRDGKLVLAMDHDLNKGAGSGSGKGAQYAYAKTGVDGEGGGAGVVLALLALLSAAGVAGWYFVRKKGLGRK